MLNRIRKLAILFIALLPVVGAGDVTEDLAKLRLAFEAEIAQTGVPQLRLYLTQLENLERVLVAEGNYAGAIQTRDEAESVRSQISRITSDSPSGEAGTSGADVPKSFKFVPGGAATSGTFWNQDSDTLGGWRSADDFARWQLPNLPPGGYEVILEYQAGSSEGGEFTISEAFFQLSGKIEPTGGEVVTKNFGTLKIRSGQAYLTIHASHTAIGGLMRLKSIELVPAWR